jgi:hypothetical protein
MWVCRFILLLVVFGGSLRAAERVFDFSVTKPGETPAGFRSTVTGEGQPGDWQVLRETLTSDLAPKDARPTVTTERVVLAQLARDKTDEHFPLLVYEEATFGDFSFTTRFKTVAGEVERMAGLAFRLQNETNYYVVRASSLGNTFRFYKVVDGVRQPPIGVDAEIPSGEWHELTVECKANQIRCLLDGKLMIPELTDNTFTEGRIAFWTKSDSVSHFADARIVYTPRDVPARQFVRDLMKRYPRLLGLQVFAPAGQGKGLSLVASNDPTEQGREAGTVEQDVVSRGVPYYGKEKGRVSVVLPLRDRNGDPVAAVRVVLRSAIGQNEENAYLRAKPLVTYMESRIRSVQDLVQ